MSIYYPPEQLARLLHELCNLPKETEWVEFKHNNADPQMIGEYISALANSAALLGKQFAYVVWGVADEDHALLGTDFKPSTTRHKQQELESWLLQKLVPKIHFQFFEFDFGGKACAILEITAANHTPVQFDGTEYVRIGSYTKKLKDHPAKERELWRTFDKIPFELQLAAENQSSDLVLKLLDYPAYFELMDLPLPDNRIGILNALEADRLIVKSDSGLWHIANLGAVLFAKQLKEFSHLARKAVRVVLYKGNNRIETIREIGGTKGYASGFEGLIGFINNLLPENEVIGQALRKSMPMFPELAVRELVVNAIIHQDFSLTGTGPMIEIFSDRMEITNPGIPLVDTQRFLDSPPRSRNEALASFLRRIGVCEERGSGIDKVVFETETYQLPAPAFEVTQEHTRAILFGHKDFKDMDKEDRIRACYLHCCLKYVNREPMNNTSLRERLGVDVKNSAMVSRIIKLALDNNLIRPYDSEAGTKAMRYIPFWA
ncbi:transcriptional regulator [Methylovulum psychrotolerans]|uniref:Transcriptional regulator n=1 Tax=Methylovulum psychrotolerans TaxID=1704499 RepID=A0A1Z4C2L2_9GAMM|nr:transcriptional regulator [Methylovulum psychrotolerans]